jgi:predicted nucleotidyltransferase
MISKESINQAVDIVVRAAHPNTVILFGSYARGNAGEESDIDLCVVEDSLSDKRAEVVRLRRALSPLRIPVDIVVHSAQTVREWGEVTGTLINSILREGKVLYEKQ